MMVRADKQTNAKDHEKLLEKRERQEEPTNKQVQKIVESYQAPKSSRSSREVFVLGGELYL